MKYLQYQIRDRFTVTVKNKVWKHGAYRLFTNVHGSKIKKNIKLVNNSGHICGMKNLLPCQKNI